MNGKKTAIAIASTALAAGLLLTGTFAWGNLGQRGMGETGTMLNPGARLHYDFDGEDLDIYAENFTDETTGQNIYARIRLWEYLEIGDGAGSRNGTAKGDNNNAHSVVDGAEFNNPGSWTIFKPAEGEQDIANARVYDESKPETILAKYFPDWKFGGGKVFMPTFNKDKDSVRADIRGTYGGNPLELNADGSWILPDTWDDGTGSVTNPYSNFKKFSQGEKMTANAVYDLDGDPDDNWYDLGVDVPDTGDGTHYKVEEETHVAKKTVASNDVITMAKWLTLDETAQKGNFWVYDEDGWAYWANPILPTDATGLLLDSIGYPNLSETYYYVVDTEAQFITQDSGDLWVNELNGGATDAAQNLMKVLELVTDAPEVTPPEPEKDYPNEWFWDVDYIDEHGVAAGDKIILDGIKNLDLDKDDKLDNYPNGSSFDMTAMYWELYDGAGNCLAENTKKGGITTYGSNAAATLVYEDGKLEVVTNDNASGTFTVVATNWTDDTLTVSWSFTVE